VTKSIKISDVQADILTTALDNGEYKGERVPWSVLHVMPTWGSAIAGLVKRGFLKERKRNMFDVTPEGEVALQAWQNEAPPMKVYG
jgi:predicted transcriptional regulator